MAKKKSTISIKIGTKIYHNVEKMSSTEVTKILIAASVEMTRLSRVKMNSGNVGSLGAATKAIGDRVGLLERLVKQAQQREKALAEKEDGQVGAGTAALTA